MARSGVPREKIPELEQIASAYSMIGGVNPDRLQALSQAFATAYQTGRPQAGMAAFLDALKGTGLGEKQLYHALARTAPDRFKGIAITPAMEKQWEEMDRASPGTGAAARRLALERSWNALSGKIIPNNLVTTEWFEAAVKDLTTWDLPGGRIADLPKKSVGTWDYRLHNLRAWLGMIGMRDAPEGSTTADQIGFSKSLGLDPDPLSTTRGAFGPRGSVDAFGPMQITIEQHIDARGATADDAQKIGDRAKEETTKGVYDAIEQTTLEHGTRP
jgi:hypothetical protein